MLILKFGLKTNKIVAENGLNTDLAVSKVKKLNLEYTLFYIRTSNFGVKYKSGLKTK